MKRPSFPLYVAGYAIGLLAIFAAFTFTLRTLNLSRGWSLVIPFSVLFFYFDEKISKLGPPRKHNINIFEKISELPARDRLIFWTITIGLSIISILGGLFLKSVDEYGLLMTFIMIAVWVGLLRIVSPALKKVLFP